MERRRKPTLPRPRLDFMFGDSATLVVGGGRTARVVVVGGSTPDGVSVDRAAAVREGVYSLVRTGRPAKARLLRFAVWGAGGVTGSCSSVLGSR